MQRAVTKSPVPEESKESASVEENDQEEKLREMAKKTGLSIETLRMVKKVEDKVTARK